VVGQTKPVLSTFLGFDGVPVELAVPGDHSPMRGSIPSYSSPERAVKALALVNRYAAWRRRDGGRVPELANVDTHAARLLITSVLTATPGGRTLADEEARVLLAHFGIELTPARPVNDLAAAIAAANELGWPAALKAAGAARVHLRDENDMVIAWNSLGLDAEAHPRSGAAASFAVVQPMVPRGVDTMLEVRDDRSFGSLLAFGVGGVATELLDDRAYAVVPLTTLDAVELISAPKAFPLLTGYAGAPEADLPALTEVALRLSRLADDLPEVVECLLHVVAAADDAYVLAAEVKVARPIASADLGARRMTGL
jgi:acyl-CoA synthetase (NDP forming)